MIPSFHFAWFFIKTIVKSELLAINLSFNSIMNLTLSTTVFIPLIFRLFHLWSLIFPDDDLSEDMSCRFSDAHNMFEQMDLLRILTFSQFFFSSNCIVSYDILDASLFHAWRCFSYIHSAHLYCPGIMHHQHIIFKKRKCTPTRRSLTLFMICTIISYRCWCSLVFTGWKGRMQLLCWPPQSRIQQGWPNCVAPPLYIFSPFQTHIGLLEFEPTLRFQIWRFWQTSLIHAGWTQFIYLLNLIQQ